MIAPVLVSVASSPSLASGVALSGDGYLYVAVDHRGGNPTAILRLAPAN